MEITKRKQPNDHQDNAFWIDHDVAFLRTIMSNVCFIKRPGTEPTDWLLVDTGLPNHADTIIQAAVELFGWNNPPKAIILTQGHFDHAGSVVELVKRWNVPVFAHPLELPYLTGQSDYPPPDPSVSHGLMARISSLYPSNGINLGHRVYPIPPDGSLPWMPGWRWLHTLGHTPGHISLFHNERRVLVAGDAFTTVQQESGEAVEKQITEVHGPPAYFTTDWAGAWDSVRRLEALRPEVAITGHGRPMRGEDLRRQLKELAEGFDVLAIPDQGKYVPDLTTAELQTLA